PGELLIGWGYDDNLMPNGQVLSRAVLDKAFPENPVVIVHVSMHGAVLNSKGFEKYGYKDGMPTPEGGVILREEDGKRLQGLVMEMAYLPISAKLPGPTLANEVEAAKAGQAMYAAAGITTAQEGLTHAEQLKQLTRIASKNGLYIDVVSYPFVTDLEEIWKTHPPATFGKYNHRLKLGGCKITADGSPQGKTAWFTTPYLTGGPAGQKDWKGEPGVPPAQMKAAMQKCYDKGLQVQMHANGDAAIDYLLKTHAEVAGQDVSKDRRTVCIHCQFVRPDQLKLLAKYNIIPTMFTDHTFFFGDTHIKNRGMAQASFISPMKSALAAGLKPTNHTDAFVVPIDQMMTVWTAVNRPLRSGGVLGPNERISAFDALKMITTNVAYQYREENTKGTIKVGKLADFVVLSADPTKVEPMTIKDIKVVETMKEGKTIYSAK
ncbi:MAG: amidohydrolase, partial [Acinetobacter sp.]